jgi:hypothetical protein
MKLEADYLTHIKQSDIQIDPSLGVDVVVCWQIVKRSKTRSNNTAKKGFLSFFGLKLLGNQLNLTEQQQKLYHQHRLN